MTPKTTENREPKLRAEEWLDDPTASAERNRRNRNTAFVEALRQHHPERDKPLGHNGGADTRQ